MAAARLTLAPRASDTRGALSRSLWRMGTAPFPAPFLGPGGARAVPFRASSGGWERRRVLEPQPCSA
jgi:hypothetical protein